MMSPRWVTRQLSASGPGQDRLAVWHDDEGLLIVVCDGAGGIGGGAQAADLAMAGLVRRLPGDPDAALLALDEHLARHTACGETTAVVAHCVGRSVRGASCGDSAAFLDGEELTTAQHRKLRLGSGRARPVGFEGHGRRLLVCTDGLCGYLRGERLQAALAHPSLSRAADALVEAVRLPSGGLMDDVALVLVELG